MNISSSSKDKSFSVTAWQGDLRTLLAFNLTKAKIARLAGFTIECRPGNQKSYFLNNFLRFEHPENHFQVKEEKPVSSVNAPLHKFRWVHVPGSAHQGKKPFYGSYTYTVTPRYFDAKGSLTKLDPSLSVFVKIGVGPFSKGDIDISFTRGYTQSQAFVRHFGKKGKIQPAGRSLLFDTSAVAGKDDEGKSYTWADEYEWLGLGARERIFAIANEVLKNKKHRLDVFAYDFNEPDIAKIFLKLAAEGRIRIILDDAALHHDNSGKKMEDQFEAAFVKAAKKPAEMKRGHYQRYAHQKVFIVSDDKGAVKVLSGSTNFSVTGLYVNSNHILVFNNRDVAATFAKTFELSWNSDVKAAAFIKAPESQQVFSFSGGKTVPVDITFSPHNAADAAKNLKALADRIKAEEKQKNGSVLFAVMSTDPTSTGPVFPVLREVHKNQNIFSYGITDSDDSVKLYDRGKKTGVIVTGRPGATMLPPPFNKVPGVGLGHQVHHKFVICGFNGPKPVVYCGSSNLAQGGEQANGDSLIALHDADIAAAFVIEALALVDHFDFLDRSAAPGETVKPGKTASKEKLAEQAEWFLSTTGKWAEPYYDKDDLHCADRVLFNA